MTSTSRKLPPDLKMKWALQMEQAKISLEWAMSVRKIGMYSVAKIWLKLESRKGLMSAIIARVQLIPAFYSTTKYGDQGWIMMLTSFLGLIHGYHY
ncbi:Equilibrative nucleotide transporter 6 [Euphorbia peplus]|nr:Equilibrative nucleotide transporter 6 [Euphorbia peplus]